MRTQRAFRPTFVATIVANDAPETGTTAKGQPYATLRSADVIREGRETVQRTIMAFGPAAGVASALIPGKPVQLAVQHDEGMLRIVGEPRQGSL